MKVVFDTNILVSSLIIPASPPHRIYEAWRAGAFVLVTCDEQIEEFRRVTVTTGRKKGTLPFF